MPPVKRQTQKNYLYELKKSIISKAHIDKIINVDYDELKGNTVRRFSQAQSLNKNGCFSPPRRRPSAGLLRPDDPSTLSIYQLNT